ncbi:ATP-dependent DNA helicase PIF1-like [Aphis craccivora]|uniref:ATP-dependent DNA helicase n=1 Tax=Aphis craccivora TaxID=307492 RepID=A0A6G0YNM4_APHCR|nr:ATP-dependent DNA helicase PIF1-like [Aphis craccivora]
MTELVITISPEIILYKRCTNDWQSKLQHCKVVVEFFQSPKVICATSLEMILQKHFFMLMFPLTMYGKIIYLRKKRGINVNGWRGIKRDQALGRVYTIHPNNNECYYLRLLLHEVRGPTSFLKLKTVNSTIQPTYQTACKAIGLLEDERHWDTTMEEAVLCGFPFKLRELFAIILIFCQLSDALSLWEKYKDSLSEDIRHRVELDIQPTNLSRCEAVFQNKDYLREINYDSNILAQYINFNEHLLNNEKSCVYNKILEGIEKKTGQTFFLDGPGGTGKTFVINILLARVRKDHGIALAVAFSGIAATLLEGGKTAHSVFKLPLNLTRVKKTMCNISEQSNIAQVLKDFTVLLAGDFRQTLPIIPRGTRADEAKSCLKASYLWPHIQKVALHKNMRVHVKGDTSAGIFEEMLLKIGDGNFPSISIPSNLCTVVSSLSELTSRIYPDIINIKMKRIEWLCERAILTPKNDKAAEINEILLKAFNEKAVEYKSFDSVIQSDDAVHYPLEFLNTLNPFGLPSHKLILKIGAPIMLLRNLNPPKLCNGTRLQVKALHKNVIEAIVITECARGDIVLIPRITLIPSDYPFEFKRIQFPLKVCFTMTINKSEGQSLSMAGIDLRDECFSHGQFFVAFSRVSSASSLVILAPKGSTKNTVYKEVLR